MPRRPFVSPLPLLGVVLALAPLGLRAAGPVFNIADFGAGGNPAVPSTDAIRAAIAACKQAGGGIVEIPPGRYLTGPIDLVDHMTLQVDAGATLLFDTDRSHYPEVLSRWEGLAERGPHPLIFAEGRHDIAIVGRGTVDGQGEAWWKTMDLAEKGNERPMDVAGKSGYAAAHQIRRRPPLVQIKDCDGVKIEGLSFINSPFWNIHLLYSEHIDVGNCRLINPPTSPNTDGLNTDSCRYVLVHDCFADVGDDGFGIKSGRDEEGRRVARPTEYVTYQRCKVAHGHSVCAIGSEPSGGVRHIRFLDCEGDGTDNGIRLKSARGRGGVVEDVVASNIKLHNVRNALVITMHYVNAPAEAFSERTPVFRDIRLDHIVATGAQRCCVIEGLQESPVENLMLEHLDLSGRQGVVCSYAKDVTFRDVRVQAAAGPAYAEDHSENVRRIDWR